MINVYTNDTFKVDINQQLPYIKFLPLDSFAKSNALIDFDLFNKITLEEEDYSTIYFSTESFRLSKTQPIIFNIFTVDPKAADHKLLAQQGSGFAIFTKLFVTLPIFLKRYSIANIYNIDPLWHPRIRYLLYEVLSFQICGTRYLDFLTPFNLQLYLNSDYVNSLEVLYTSKLTNSE